MDRIAREGVLGRSNNVPDRFLPASDVATLSLFGYDPERYYTGRAPLEAAAMGIALGPDDWAVRCNLMTIRDGRMTDFTAGHITSEEGRQLIEALQAEVGRPGVEFHPGVSYRNLMIYRGRPGDPPFGDDTKTTPPHDVPDQPAADHLPRGDGRRPAPRADGGRAEGRRRPPGQPGPGRGRQAPGERDLALGPGEGPAAPAASTSCTACRGRSSRRSTWSGASACSPAGTGSTSPARPATSTPTTPPRGDTRSRPSQDHDIVCVHVEAPDEASHEGRADAKVEALERIDRDIVGPAAEAPGNVRRRGGSSSPPTTRPCCGPGPTTAPSSPGRWPGPA